MDATDPAGFHKDYQHGHIYWSPKSEGAHTIAGPIYDKWQAQGGPKTNWGYPVTDDAPTADNQAQFNNFSIGAIYSNPSSGAHLVYGNIYLKWLAIGAEPSFGYPVADEAPAGHGRVSQFSRGAIYWSGPTAAHTLVGDIRIRYDSLGGPTSFLGLPTTDETDIPGATGRMNKFEGGAIYWYGSASSIWVQRGPLGPAYTFAVDQIACTTTRSRSTDTLHISVTVAIAGRDPIVQTKSLGDHAEGFTFPALPLQNIPLADDEIAVFTYLIINNGHSTESDVHKLLETAAVKLADTGAQAAAKVIGEGAKAAAGAAMGALLGSAVAPVIGTIVGAALGAVSAFLLGDLIDTLNPNCDGPVASAAMTIGGKELRERVDAAGAGGVWSHQDSNPGIDSPGGCGANSVYQTTWSVKRA